MPKVELTDQEVQALLSLLGRATIQGTEAEAFLQLISKFGQPTPPEPKKDEKDEPKK